jgi:hypothetical protein
VKREPIRTFIRAPQPIAALLFLVCAVTGCREIIPTTPQFTSTNALDYFWNGTPYNPSYEVTDSLGSELKDQVDLRSSIDSILLTDGLGAHLQMHFSLFRDSVLLDKFAANKLFVLPEGYYFSSGSGPTEVVRPVHVRTLFYDRAQRLLFAGTDSNGIWYTSNGVSGKWFHAAGAVHAGILGFARTEDYSIFAIGFDSVYLSTDGGKSFFVTAEGKFKAIASRGNNVFFGGSDVEEIVRPSNAIHLFTPQLPANFTSSIISLAVCGERLVAGVYQSSSTNHLLTIPIGGSAWESPPQQPVTSTNMFALIANAPRVFAGTNGDSVIVSSDSGRNWRPFSSSGASGHITCFASSGRDTVNYAGTSDGLLLSLRVLDIGNVSTKLGLSGHISSIAVESANGYVDTVMIAGDTLSCWSKSGTGRSSLPPSTVISVTHPGVFKLLDAAGGLRFGSSWNAGYLNSTRDTVVQTLTGRVLEHLDSLVLPLKAMKETRKDVFVVRYAIENSSQSPTIGTPYWIFYYEKGLGPVIIDLFEIDPTSLQPKLLNASVYEPPA